MKIIRYFFKDLKAVIYFVLSLCISLLADMAMNMNFSCFYKLILPVMCVLFILRTDDDIYDYEKDRGHKRQYLSKGRLVVLNTVLWLLFFCVNLLFYKTKAIYSIFAFVYMLFIHKAAIFKLCFGACLFGLFAVINSVETVMVYIFGMTAFFAASCIFYFIKKRKNYDFEYRKNG